MLTLQELAVVKLKCNECRLRKRKARGYNATVLWRIRLGSRDGAEKAAFSLSPSFAVNPPDKCQPLQSRIMERLTKILLRGQIPSK